MTTRVLFALPLVVAGCLEHVASKPPPTPDVVFYAGTEPVTPGTELSLMVAWTGWCKYSTDPNAELSGNNNDYPCQFVANTVDIRCPDQSCTWRKTGDDGYVIIPTRPGILHATVIVTRSSNGRKSITPLGPVEVVAPTTAAVRCELSGAGAFVTATLTANGKPVQDPNLAVALSSTAACDSYGSMLFFCPITVPGDQTFTLSTPSYRLQAAAPCA